MKNTTKQGVRNLNDMGTRPKKSNREGFALCVVGRHEGGKWRKSELGNFDEELCQNCEMVLTDNNPEEREGE